MQHDEYLQCHQICTCIANYIPPMMYTKAWEVHTSVLLFCHSAAGAIMVLPCVDSEYGQLEPCRLQPIISIQ